MQTKKITVCLVESLVVNIASYYLFYVLQNNQDVYLNLNPHPCFLLSLFMGARYGNVAGLVSSVISCTFYVYVHFDLYQNVVNIFIDFTFYKFLLMFIVGAMIPGYIRDKFDYKSEMQKNEIAVLTDNYKCLKKTYQALEKTQQELKKQIINSEESILHLHGIASKLDTLDMEEVYTETVGILKKYLKADTISIYSYNEGTAYLRLKIKIGQSSLDKRSLDIRNSTGFTKVVLEKRAIKCTEVNEDNFPLMAAPIMKEDTVLAVVNIEGMDFDKLSEYAFQLFKLIVDLVNKALGQAIYVDELKESKYIQGTNWLRYHYFVERLNEEERRQKEFGMEYCLLDFIWKQQELTYLSEVLSGYLRSVDVVGYDEDKGIIFILLPATPKDHMMVVEERIQSKIGHLLAPPQLELVSIDNPENGENQQRVQLVTEQVTETEPVQQFEDRYDYDSYLEEVAVSLDNTPVPEAYMTKDSENSSYQVPVKELLIEGVHLAKDEKLPQAVRNFNRILKSQPEPEMKFLTVSELYSLYQNRGLYNLAVDVVSIHAKDPDLKNHPGMLKLIEKSRYIQCLMQLLDQYQCGHIPYQMIPEKIKEEAFRNYLRIAS